MSKSSLDYIKPRVEGEATTPTVGSAEEIARVLAMILKLEIAHTGWLPNYLARHEKRFAHDLDLVLRYAVGTRVLDVGASPPVLVAAMASQNYDVKGVDLDPSRFSNTIRARSLDVYKADVEREALPFGDGSHDTVVFNEIFEHLRIDPIFTLSEVLRVLRPGGRLLLSTPNLASIYGLANLLLKNQGASCSPGVYEQYQLLELVGHMGHVREYTTTEVTDFLTKVGFRPKVLVMRGLNGPRWVRPILRALPSRRPFFSVVAERP